MWFTDIFNNTREKQHPLKTCELLKLCNFSVVTLYKYILLKVLLKKSTILIMNRLNICLNSPWSFSYYTNLSNN